MLMVLFILKMKEYKDMIRTYCDVCKREAETELHMLRTKEVQYGCDNEKVYMCKKCSRKYNIVQKKMDMLFIKNNGNIDVHIKNNFARSNHNEIDGYQEGQNE